MKILPPIFLCLVVLFRLVVSLSPTYLPCQLQKPPGVSALAGCPKGTLYVSSTDPTAKFSSIQKAINILPDTGKAVILIGEGQYFEMVNVTRRASLVLLGQLDPTTAFIQGGNASQRNIVHIWNNLYVKDGMNDEETATLTVRASHGRNVDFKAYNIDFENRAANYSISQALVTAITWANASFYGCTFASWQDTWYTGRGGNTYVVDSIIYGQTDYLFGSGVAWFQSVILANRGCGGGITAWRGTPNTTNGVYIADSSIIRSPDVNSTIVTTGQCSLGRPWNIYAVAIFLHNYMDDSIMPSGFTSWDDVGPVPNTTTYAEFDSYGSGGNSSARVKQDHILSLEEVQAYRLEAVFQETPGWIDFGYLSYWPLMSGTTC